jgi:hypothetical protein
MDMPEDQSIFQKIYMHKTKINREYAHPLINVDDDINNHDSIMSSVFGHVHTSKLGWSSIYSHAPTTSSVPAKTLVSSPTHN